MSLHIYLLDVVAAYLHGIFDTIIFVSPPSRFLSHISSPTPGRYTSLKMLKALYGLKYDDRICYHHLCNFLFLEDFTHKPAIPGIFTYSRSSAFVIVTVYVDDLNVIGTFDLCQYIQKC